MKISKKTYHIYPRTDSRHFSGGLTDTVIL